MLRRLAQSLMILMLLSGIGLHWALAQLVVWAQMVNAYTEQTGSVIVALSHTLDGEHPCHRCERLAHAMTVEAEAKSRDNPSGSSPNPPVGIKKLKLDPTTLCQPLTAFPPCPLATSLSFPPYESSLTPAWDSGPEPPPPEKGLPSTASC
jgi:hypothetical protein